MAKQKLNLAASVQVKNGRLYAVIQLKENGKTKPIWRTLGLPEGSPKTKIQKAFRETVNNFEQTYLEELERRSRPESEIGVYEYMVSYLARAKPNLQKSTYQSYNGLINGKIKRFFTKHPELTIGSLRPQDIDAFYNTLYADGSQSATVLHYHSLLRKAFQVAFIEERITVNPFDRVQRPKKSTFQGEHYSEEELLTLLSLTRSDVIYPAIILAGGLGLRRSEALGVRWSRINWDDNTVLLDTKIMEYDEDGKTILEPIEEMKNTSSRRTLPLPVPVLEMLKEEKEKQEMYRKLFKGSYNRKFDDYVCVDQMGNLLRPDYVTNHFGDLLEKYGLRKIRFHDLRHTFASLLLAKEEPLINVSNFLGHSTISTTANIYAHLDKSSKQHSADIITGILQPNNS